MQNSRSRPPPIDIPNRLEVLKKNIITLFAPGFRVAVFCWVLWDSVHWHENCVDALGWWLVLEATGARCMMRCDMVRVVGAMKRQNK